MATFTTRLGLRKPVGTDLVQVLLDIDASMDTIDAAIARVCTSSTRPSTPFVGMTAFETDTKGTIVCVSTGPAVWQYVSIPIMANQAARNALVAHDGLSVYRQDTDRFDMYNGTGWTSPSIPIVSAGSDITSPQTGMIVLLISDLNLYRWTGSAWVKYVAPSFVAEDKPVTTVSSSGTTEKVMSNVTASLGPGKFKAEYQGDFSVNTGTGSAVYQLRQSTGAGVGITGTIFKSSDSNLTAASNTQVSLFGTFDVVTAGTFTVVMTAKSNANNVVQAYAAGGHTPQLLLTQIA